MKLALLAAAGIALGASLPKTVQGAPRITQSVNVPPTETLRRLIVGEWVDSGPSPSATRITRTTIWNSPCWERYKIIGVRPGRMNKIAAYIVEIEITSGGGASICSHDNQPGFSLALISANEVLSGDVESISWMMCPSKKEFDSVLKHQDPRDSNEACSTFVSDRYTRRLRH